MYDGMMLIILCPVDNFNRTAFDGRLLLLLLECIHTDKFKCFQCILKGRQVAGVEMYECLNFYMYFGFLWF